MEKEFRDRDPKVDLFYAETDLDQPTDYSLRYAEDDTDDEEKQSTEYFTGGEQEDTVKTYCTEGTPYETPFNFSTATSMSDLRVEDTKESDVMKKVPKKAIEVARKSPVSFIKQVTSLGCDEHGAMVRKEEELEENPKDTTVLNPGQVTPEKINNIPGVISKIDSANKEELENDDHSVLSDSQMRLSSQNSGLSVNKSNSRVLDKEGKMVTFGGQDYYAEETPLMFSRCSSLGSLSGFEQHSIHDDRSSVVSDFSRRTSGVVSPSELPDSPTQTVLPSPRNHKTQNAEFMSKMQEEAVRPSVRHLSYPKPQVTRSSVFEDEVATFKEESTPAEFSTATSLSSLTIDDEVKIPNDTMAHCRLEKVSSDTDEKNIRRIETDMLNMTINSSNSKVKEEQVSDGDEDDEDMLAACINMGMQTNRYRQSFKMLNSQKPAQSEPSSILAPYQKNSVPNRLKSHVSLVETSIGASKTSKTAMEIGVAPDTVHVYCTEDTPADISPVGSQSNLSALSMPSVQEDIEKIEQEKSAEIACHRNDLSDESSNLSGEDEKILDECIQSGIPKPRQITPPLINNLPFVKKSELPSHKFNIYSTPSSSPVETSHANKNSIMAKSVGNTSLRRHPDELSDDSPNHSDDEAILTECIQSAMPKARFSVSPSIRPSLSQTIENTKTTDMRTSSTSSAYFQSGHMEQRKTVTRKLLPFEDNVGLSEEEEDIILAQCIRSGMPKVLSSMSTTMAPAVKKFDAYPRAIGNFPVYLSSSYCVSKVHPVRNVALHPPSSFRVASVATTDRFIENATSSNFNCYPDKATNNMAQTSSQTSRNSDSNAREKINNSPHCARRSPHHRVESENVNTTVDGPSSRSPRVANCGASMVNRTENDEDDSSCRNMTKLNAVPSCHSSVSSHSEEGSLISTEEWALLELCITSAMPRNKYSVKGIKPNEGAGISGGHDDCEPIPEDNYSVCSYNSYVCKT
ncbi:PREDICTED: adenomatous polyposis coli homolog isoform X2 [Dinoponera quadriceps]|uniref:Adenomatous polyposis coli homolog isoform X2 n=1 Tax=Dinoponera quadriceps TaxID=609295 RepID=A0A6P3Y0S6_DINQU|nr:PREDICTED: adenomatous polyposis coli homolog isoform X2 [Dinoponera quadriceps]